MAVTSAVLLFPSVLDLVGEVVVRIDGVDHHVDEWPVDGIVGNGHRHSPVRSDG